MLEGCRNLRRDRRDVYIEDVWFSLRIASGAFHVNADCRSCMQACGNGEDRTLVISSGQAMSLYKPLVLNSTFEDHPFR